MTDTKMKTFNAEEVRSQFPVLSAVVHGKKVAYLDSGATTLKPQSVIDRLTTYYTQETANIHRGIHTLSELSTEKYEKTRDQIQELINAESRKEIIFTKGTTDSLNILAHVFGQAFISEGDEIIISTMEHHSNIVPWQLLCERTKAVLKVIPVNQKGELLIEEYENLLTNKTKLVSINHISNSLGTINPIKEIITSAHKFGAKVMIDAAQSIAHTKIDVQDLDCDFMAFSGHKMYGPTGVGILYGKEDLLNALPPHQGGGDMIDQVTFEKTTYNDLPYKFEAGTPNIAGVIGLGAAVEFLNSLDYKKMNEFETELLTYGTEKLSKIPGIKFIGTASKKSNIISFVIDEIHAQDIATFVDRSGIAIRTGHHCTQPLLKELGVDSTCRVSLSIYNTKEDLDRLYESLMKVVDIFN
jgi:cysteine desulfurase/selenocysteine lyase